MTIGEYCKLMQQVDDDIFNLDMKIERGKHCGMDKENRMIEIPIPVAEEYLEVITKMQDLIKSLKVE